MKLWQESKNGNLFFRLGGKTVTIFKPKLGTKYSIAIYTDGEDTIYHNGFKTEQDAVRKACELFGVNPDD